MNKRTPLSKGPGGVGRADGRSSLRLWLKADVDVISRDEYVLQWLDKSGYGNNAVQVVASAQPTFILNNPEFNGMPTIRFNGASHFLRINHHDSLSLTDHMTIFIVFKPNNLYRSHGLLSKSRTCGDEGNYALAVNGQDRTLLFEHYNHTWWRFTSDQSIADQPLIMAFSYDTRFGGGGFGVGGNFIGQFKNRMQLKANRESLDIGVHRRCRQKGVWLNGDLAEVIIYRGNVNTAQRIIIENYLSAKYRIPLLNTSRGKDIFRGNHTEYGSYVLDVAGLGHEADGKHREAHSAGLTVRDVSFLQHRGAYFMFGHKSPTNNIMTSENLPAGVNARWERLWYFDLTDQGHGSGQLKLTFIHPSNDMADPTIRHVLLERPDEYTPFEVIAESDENSEKGTVSFTIPAHSLVSGRLYTLGQMMPATMVNLFMDTMQKVSGYLKRKSQPLLAINEQPTQRRIQHHKPRSVKLVALNQPYIDKADELTHDDMHAALNTTRQAIKDKLPRDLLIKIEAIQQAILKTLPYIPDITSSDPTVYAVRQITLEYMPETLENYLSLPPEFALHEPLKDNKTARQLLMEQLDVLDQQLNSIVTDFHRHDAKKLLAHGRFLQEKFGESESLLD